jgi:FkbM family methyltransferase
MKKKIFNFLSNLSLAIPNIGFFNSFKVFLFYKFFFKGRIKYIKIKKLDSKFYFNTITALYRFYNHQYCINFKQKPSQFIDIGATLGEEAIRLTSIYGDVKIDAIEPNLESFNLLKKNTENYSNIKCHNIAIFKNNDNISIAKSSTEAQSVRFTNLIEELKFESEKVDCLTFNHFLKINNIEFIDLVKININGGEKYIFENGDDNWIKNTKAIVVMTFDNINNKSSEIVFNKINKYNFQCFTIERYFIFINPKYVDSVGTFYGLK